LVEGVDFFKGDDTAGIDSDATSTIAFKDKITGIKGNLELLKGGQISSWYANTKYGGAGIVMDKIKELSGNPVNNKNAQVIFNNLDNAKQLEVLKTIYKHEAGSKGTMFKIPPILENSTAKIDQARSAGKTDAEILNYLGSADLDLKTKISQARRKGISETEILNYLSTAATSKAPTSQPVAEKQVGGINESEFVNNILSQKQKEAGGVLDTAQEDEIKRQIEINKNTLIGFIDKAAEQGVDKNLATRLVERGMYDKLQELMQTSGAAQKMGKESALTFKNVINTMYSAEKMLGDLYGQTIAMGSKDVQGMQKSQQDLHDQSLKLIKAIRDNRTKGKDTTKLEKQLSDITGVASTEFEDLFDVQNLTNQQVIGASAGTVLDALGGSFTKAGAAKISNSIAGKGAKTFSPNILEGMVKQSGSQMLKQAGRTALVLGKEGAELGGLYGLAQGAMNDEDVVGILKSGALGVGTGFLLGSATGLIGSGISSRSYNQNAKKLMNEFNGVKTTGTENLNPLQKLGAKISEVYVKPQQSDINNGYKTINIAKYDVGGSLDKALPKVQAKIKNYTDQLNEYIKLRGEEPTLTYGKVLDELETKYAEKGEQKLGMIGDKAAELDKIKNELTLKYGDNWKEEQIGFTDVMDDKRSAGLQAVFNHDPLRKGVGATEQVWNDFYTNLKKKLEENSPKEFQEINKAITDLIPIEQGYVRAARRMDKNNVLSLTDFIGATGAVSVNPAALAVPIIHRVFKSPRVANLLMKTGSIEKALGTVPTDELAKWGIKKYGNGIYDVDGIKVNTMNIKPETIRKTIIDLKKSFKDVMKPKSGFIDLNAPVLPKKEQVVKNIQAKQIIDKSKPTTKILNELNGKPSVKRQFVEDLMKRPDISKVEKEILTEALKTEGDVIDSKLFAQKVQNELLPLKTKVLGNDNTKYKYVTLPDETRGNVANYSEHIYQSPIKTSAGNIHWDNIGGGRTADEIALNKANNKIENYFGHTRVEDMADSSLDKAMRKSGKTRRVIELQSDLYQKNRLNNEVATEADRGIYNTITKTETPTKRLGDLQKLQQYSDPTAHFRMVREEVKQAAIDGKEKLQFPTGETAMEIEGLGKKTNFYNSENKTLTQPELEKGKTVYELTNQSANNTWIITDVLEDGKFKAMPKNRYESYKELEFDKEKFDNDVSQYSETFDISGKVDTNNPIYKFYQDTLGKYLKNRYKATEITDANGVKWYEMDIKPEMKDEPVLAFGNTDIKTLLGTGAVLGVGALIAGLASEKKQKGLTSQTEQKSTVSPKIEPNKLSMPVFSENKIPKMDGTPLNEVKLPTETPKTIKSIKITHGKQTWEIKDPEEIKIANRIKFISDQINPDWTNYLLKLANFEGVYKQKQRNYNYKKENEKSIMSRDKRDDLIKKGYTESVDRGIFQINNKAFPQITDQMADNLDFSILWAISLIDAGKQDKWAADKYGLVKPAKITIE
jgi:hypothetical protein